MSVIIKLLSKFDDSGLKRAKSGFSGLTKTLGAVGIGFGISQITNGLLDAAKAAAADEKSTRLLNTQLARNAGATKEQLKQNDAFIESLSLQTGIMDDDLRPAMARFGNITGNVKDAQKLLKITLDASAGSQLSQTKIAKAVGQAYSGNTKQLQGMFPQLKKSKDVLGDFAKTYAGLAEANADPFMKFNNSMDILKEKLGVLVLPLIIDFIDEISKPGGAIEVVSKFFDDLANPKSDAGKTFAEIKKAVGETIEGLKTFFGYFGDGDAMKGFTNIATNLIRMLPALLALKAIMMLASAGKAIQSLVTAMTMIQGQGAIPTGGGGVPPVVAPGAGIATKGTSLFSGMGGIKALSFLKLAPMIGIGMGGNITDEINPRTGKTYGQSFIDSEKARLAKQQPQSIFNITVTNADPKATVDAIAKYVKQNGALPSYFITGKVGR